MPQKTQAARNFPKTVCAGVIGSVIRSSIVPCLRSSAHRRIEMAGIRNRYSQGCQPKKPWSVACSPSYRPPRKNVSTPESTRKMTMKT